MSSPSGAPKIRKKKKKNEWSEETHIAPITSLEFHNKSLYVGYKNGLLRQFELSNGEISFEYDGHLGSITSIKLSDTELFSGSKDATVRVWNKTSGASQGQMDTSAPVLDMALNYKDDAFNKNVNQNSLFAACEDANIMDISP